MTLQARLLAAQACDDRAALVTLYTEAADNTADIDAACFYLTHAYIFALKQTDPASQALYQRLKARRRA